MTRREIADTFARDIAMIPSPEFDALIELGCDDSFADEAGIEFMTALAQVGIGRVSI